jgi:hypothetical protein
MNHLGPSRPFDRSKKKRIPNQLDPGGAVMIVKLMQVLEQEGSILDRKIQDTQTTFIF